MARFLRGLFQEHAEISKVSRLLEENIARSLLQSTYSPVLNIQNVDDFRDLRLTELLGPVNQAELASRSPWMLKGKKGSCCR